MRRFVFWTGMISVLAGIAFQFPDVSLTLMPGVRPGMTTNLFGMLVFFTGLMLVLSSRDLQHRGILVAWEGVHRLLVLVVMATYGILGDAGLQAVIGGMVDGLIGAAYLVALPRHLGVSLTALLLNRRLAYSGD